MPKNNTAKYKCVTDSGGYRFLFYCDVSDAHVYTTKEIYKGESEEDTLLTAWNGEASKHFNQCHRCGKWVIDAVYNAEVLECVECAPYEAEPKYCKNCGVRLEKAFSDCPHCGKKLIYEGSANVIDSKG